MRNYVSGQPLLSLKGNIYMYNEYEQNPNAQNMDFTQPPPIGGGYVAVPQKKKYKIPDCDLDGLSPEIKKDRKILRKFHPECKEIRKLALFCGLLMLIIEAVPVIIVYGNYYLGDSIGMIFYPFYFAANFLHTFCGSFAATNIDQILYSTLLFIVPFTILAKSFKLDINKIAKFSRPKKGLTVPCLLIGVSFCSFANIAASQTLTFLETIGFTGPGGAGGGSSSDVGIVGFILAFISTAIIPGLVEEFAFRGILFGALEKFGQGFALLSTSILFGVLHGNIAQIPFAFLVGLGVGYVRVKTGSVWLCVIVHTINNGISVLYDYPLSGLPDGVQNLSYAIYLAVALLFGIVGIILLSKKENEKELFSLKKQDATCDTRVTNRIFYMHPMILIFFAVIALGLLGGYNYSWIKNLW